MSEENFRLRRIERLLKELRYECERGMLEREIEEEIHFRFIVPLSRHFKEGVVMCEFQTRPVPRAMGFLSDPEPRLRVVKGGK